VAGLEGEVMIVDPRPVLHFLEVDDVLLFLRRRAAFASSNLNFRSP